MTAKTCLAPKDVITQISLMFCFQSIGGSILISVGKSIFIHSLLFSLSTVVAVIVSTGATHLRNVVPPQFLKALLIAYNTT